VLKRVSKYVGGPCAIVFNEDTVTRKGDAYFSWGTEPRFAELYWQTYVRLNPFVLGSYLFPIEEIFSTVDMMPYEEYGQTRFYAEWVEPQGWGDLPSANLERSSTGRAAFVVPTHTRDGPASESHLRRMKLLVPHVRRALVIGKVIDLSKVEAAALADTLDGVSAAIFLVDACGQIVHSNASAQAMLADGAVVRAGDKLVLADASVQQSLRDTLAAAESGDAAVGVRGIAVPLASRDGAHHVMHVLPLTSGARRSAGSFYSAVAAVFIRKSALDPAQPLLALARQFHLTPAELRVLSSIVEVGGVPDVAPALGISEATVKTHLRRVFDKTGTGRQADLVKLVAGYASPLLN
jgi:DNA-binding CsgD family transcriptional regulator